MLYFALRKPGLTGKNKIITTTPGSRLRHRTTLTLNRIDRSPGTTPEVFKHYSSIETKHKIDPRGTGLWKRCMYTVSRKGGGGRWEVKGEGRRDIVCFPKHK